MIGLPRHGYSQCYDCQIEKECNLVDYCETVEYILPKLRLRLNGAEGATTNGGTFAMSNEVPTRTPRRLAPGRSLKPTGFWSPEEKGVQIFGIVRGIKSTPIKNNNERDAVILDVLNPDNGELTGQTVLVGRSAVLKGIPFEAGAAVCILYLGEVTPAGGGMKYKDYDVNVVDFVDEDGEVVD